MPRKPSLVDRHEEELYTKGRDGRKPFVFTHDLVEGGQKSMKRLLYTIVFLLISSFTKDEYDKRYGKLAQIEEQVQDAAENTVELKKAVDDVKPIVDDVADKIDQRVLPAVRAARDNSRAAAQNVPLQQPKQNRPSRGLW